MADVVARSGVADLVACYSRTETDRKAFAARHGCRASQSWEAMLGDPEVQGVILTTPHTVHATQIAQAAEAGRHVLVEKPFTLGVDDGREAIAAAQSAGTVLMVGHQRRRQSANRRIKEMIDSGELGIPLLASSTFNVSKGYPPTWRADLEQTPLGGMTGLGVHMVDTFHYMLGPIATVSAFSRGVIPDQPLHHATGLLFDFESGAVGTLLTSHFAPAANRLSIQGTKAAAYNVADGAQLLLQRLDETSPTPVEITPNDELVDQITEFAGAIRGTTQVTTGGEVGLAVVAVMEAAVASARQGGAPTPPNYT